MLGVVKWVGYVLAAVVVFAVALLAMVFVFMVKWVLLVGAAIAFIAICVQDYCESKKTRP